MSYIGSTPTTQSFIAGTDYFNGNGSTVNFTLSRSVNSVNDIEVIVNNVEQIPSGYSVSGTTLTFSAAPSAGTSNVYVRYLSTTNLSLAIPSGTSATFNTVTVADGSATTPSITNDGDTNTGIFFPAADTIAFSEGGAESMRIDSAGDVGIGTTSPSYKLHVVNAAGGDTIVLDNGGGAGDGASTYLAFSGTNTGANFVRGRIRGAFPDATGGGLAFETGTSGSMSERMRIDSSGNLLVGTTSTLGAKFALYGTQNGTNNNIQITNPGVGTGCLGIQGTSSNFKIYNCYSSGTLGTGAGIDIDTNGNVLVGTTTNSPAGNNVVGAELQALGSLQVSRDGGSALQVNRKTDDGELVAFRQAGTQEGSISVSGTTVSYNGGHLARWAQTTTAKDESLVKGTVLSNLDEMNVYTDADGNPVDNEQLNKVKVSDVEGDPNVAGVFVNWTHDDAHDVDEINMAMTGDMIIRIAQGTIVARGDLLMSAGDGTAKPQGDDIVRSKTVAKVTSTHVTCTYADGSYCVPCVLMAC